MEDWPQVVPVSFGGPQRTLRDNSLEYIADTMFEGSSASITVQLISWMPADVPSVVAGLVARAEI